MTKVTYLTSLLRPTLPTWRFFENAEETAILYFRHGEDRNQLGDWITFAAKPGNRRIFDLFTSAAGNLELAKHALVERLTRELSPENEIEETVSYQLVVRLVHFLAPENACFQFKISLRDEDVLISPVFESGIGHLAEPATGNVTGDAR